MARTGAPAPAQARQAASYATRAVGITTPSLAAAFLQCWDLGGQQALRGSWDSYFKDTDAVIIMVDSTDRLRSSIVKLELQRLLEADELAAASILVFANKQDVRDAMTVAELTDVLGLQSVRTHEWTVQPSCALTGEGLHDGLAWLVQRVTRGLVPVTQQADGA
jgi:ADP-ribosylation factor-like protein 5B